MANYLTITMTGRPPVKIDKDLWPIEAHTKTHDGGEFECQANRSTWVKVRRHQDGRRIVYGHHGTNWQGEHNRRAGELIPADALPDGLQRALERVCAELGAPDLVQRVLQNMPAETLD